jgi:excisionase family DNA binding protein
MQITVREAARHLSVSEATVRQWIKKRGLPAHHVDDIFFGGRFVMRD